VRAEEVSGAGGGEGGGEEAAGARAAAAAAGAQADHRLIRLHASGGRIRPESESRGSRSRNRRARGGKSRRNRRSGRVEGLRLRPLLRGREEKGGEAWATGGGGVLSVELGLQGLYRSSLRSGEGSFVIACKVLPTRAGVRGGPLSACARSGGDG
jgi:hypothetical protein